MPRFKRSLFAMVAVGSIAALAACSSGDSGAPAASDKAGGGAAPASYGDCEVFGDAGSIKLTPVNADELTVQTNLPSPGWWKGESPTDITGGFEFCLAANIAHRAGLPKVNVENVSFDALVAGQTKGYDMAMAQISVTPEREKVVTFSAPYFDSNLGVLAPKGSTITADNIGSKKIGVQVGTTAVEWVQKTLKPGTAPQLFQDTTSMVTAVQSELVDAAIQDTAIMLGFAKNSNGELEVIGQYDSGEQYAAIYEKDSKNAEAINAGIEAMRTDGTLDKLSAKWLGPELGGDPNAVPVWSLK